MAKEITYGGDGELFVGEDKTLELHVLDVAGAPVDMAGKSGVFVVAKSDKADPLLSVAWTVTGTFDASKAANTQRLRVILTDDNMNLFKAATYRHAWKDMTADNELILAYGDFAPEKAPAV